MAYFNIGASAASGAVPCYSEEAWTDLLAAMARGDSDEIIRIATSARPTMVPTASLKPIERRTMAESAAAFWAKRGKAPKARAAGPDGTPVVRVVRT